MFPQPTYIQGVNGQFFLKLPCFFILDNKNGFLLKPEAGFRFNLAKLLGLSLNFSYCYGIPVVAENDYLYSPHELYARIELSTNVEYIKEYLDDRKRRRKTEK